MKRLFLSFAFSDLALGLIAQLTFVVINAVMLKMAANGDFDFDFFCPRLPILEKSVSSFVNFIVVRLQNFPFQFFISFFRFRQINKF